MATRKKTDRAAAEAWLSEPVTVRLFRDNGSYKEDKVVTVNGETVRIPRGEDVIIPRLESIPGVAGIQYGGGFGAPLLDGGALRQPHGANQRGGGQRIAADGLDGFHCHCSRVRLTVMGIWFSKCTE